MFYAHLRTYIRTQRIHSFFSSAYIYRMLNAHRRRIYFLLCFFCCCWCWCWCNSFLPIETYSRRKITKKRNVKLGIKTQTLYPVKRKTNGRGRSARESADESIDCFTVIYLSFQRYSSFDLGSSFVCVCFSMCIFSYRLLVLSLSYMYVLYMRQTERNWIELCAVMLNMLLNKAVLAVASPSSPLSLPLPQPLAAAAATTNQMNIIPFQK